MMLRSSLRGQPLAVLCLVLGGWATFRAMTWQPPAWATDNYRATGPLAQARQNAVSQTPLASAEPGGMSVPEYLPMAGLPQWYPQALPMQAGPGWYNPAAAGPSAVPVVQYAPHVAAPVAPVASGQEPMLAAGHQLMWMAALARLAVPPEMAAYMGGQSAPAAPAPIPLSPGLAAQQGTNRWSADAWMLMRQQGPTTAAAGRPIYGGSQIGAVLRYQLDPNSGHRPIAYLRGTSSLGAIRESEVAAGLGVRPIAGFPLVVAAEARAFRTMGDTSFRPAAIAYTELQPKDLPADFVGEAYFQGGYVGGKYATPFVDGQIRIDRKVGRIGQSDLRLGAGIWGGAQKGAKRLDIGPGATTNVKVLGRNSRVSMDYRFRVAGDAKPGSGPALTVAAGF